MARPKKTGLTYFPLDCQMDDKIEMLEAEHGLEGFAIYLKLLQHIYQTEAGELDMSVVFRWKTLPKQWGIPAENFRKTVETMLEIALFDSAAFAERQVLTSNGIHKRIKEVADLRAKDRRRKTEGKPEFSEGFPAEKYTKGKGKDTSVSQKETEKEMESSRSSGEGEPEKKMEGAENAATDSLPAQTPAPSPPGCAAPPAPPAPRRFETWRDYDGPWPEQVHPPFGTPAFHSAWAKWGKYLAEIDKGHGGPTREDEDLLRLRQLAGTDHELALHIISTSISCGWKSLNKPTHELNRRTNRPGLLAADPTERHNIPAQHDFAQDAA
ncbi:DUF4373 domain-containing protein [Hymenobacter sp. RP-2-7]|uniref:DUF4373 domain-containing protein n=1 Tax=Hymenobacter polaris TaxID=2682546 RepID=A0A7Y0AHS2_9BACT|nr:DUF4373 domain-containing protein [Hymenobacter polaris]NML67631.1 DUF4373 domain-containing protein [Hymenobacter polaris]